jgi:hypothetical protein
MSDWVVPILSIILAIPAIILALLSYLDTRRIRREFDSSLGTPQIQINWGNPGKQRVFSCRVTAMFNRVNAVKLRVGKEERAVGDLAEGEGRNLDFEAVPEGTKFKLIFIDPVDHRKYKKNGIIRYGKLDL